MRRVRERPGVAGGRRRRPFSRGYIGAPPAPAERGVWLAGDLHVHTTYSHDSWGGPYDDNTSDPQDWYTLGHSVASEFTLAKSRGLDYLAITDHNDIRAQQDPDFGAGGVIGIPAYENSLKGHGQMLGARRIYEKGDGSQAPVQQMADELHADGGLLQVNHPHDPQWGYDRSLVPDSIEVWNLPWLYQAPFPASSDNEWALNWYEGWLDQGFHIAATGGSDSHWVSTSALQGVGQPTTWVFAGDRSADGVLDGIKRGRTFVSYQPPAYGGPKVLLEGDTPKPGAWDAMLGDTVPRASKLRARVMGAPGAQLKLTTNHGKTLAQVPVTSPDFTYDFALPKGSSSTWVLAELFGDDLSAQRKAACDDAVGDQTSYCRNRVLMLGVTSPIYFAG
jgi:hypothetical protein